MAGRAGKVERTGAAVEQVSPSATASCSLAWARGAANFAPCDLLAIHVAMAPSSFTGAPPPGCGRFT